MMTKIPKLSRLAALVVLLAAVGAAPSANAQDPDACEATVAAPHCAFRCPAWGVVQILVHGPGDEGYVQGTISCGSSDGGSGHLKVATVYCPEGDGKGGGVIDDALDAVQGALDDGECSGQLENTTHGTQGACSLQAGTRAVCRVVRESLLPEV